MIARPEPPRARFQTPPFAPSLRQQLPRQEFGPSSSYGPPSQHPVYGTPPQQPDITKSVFVHLPPEENDGYPLPPQVLPVQPPKKHYKIIFIKAPEPPKVTPPIIPPQPQDEHKTLVYVLVKKPDEQPQIELPIPETTQPTKPEVYFIKYNVKNNKTPDTGYGYPAAPTYGPPAAVPPQIDESYGPPSPPKSEADAF